MDDGRGKERSEPRDGKDEGLQWPQRPARPEPVVARPRLDPPDERARPQRGDNTPNTYRATTPPRPGSGAASREGDTKETQVLPIVEPSRFARGAQTRAVPGVPAAPQVN